MLLTATRLRLLKLDQAHMSRDVDDWLVSQGQLREAGYDLASTLSHITNTPNVSSYTASLVVWPLTIAASLARSRSQSETVVQVPISVPR